MKLLTEKEFAELWADEGLKVKDDEIDDNWRHGNNHSTVYEVLDTEGNPTGVFYRAHYQVSGDGEYHGIRDKEFDLERVEPEEVVVKTIKWNRVEEKKE